MDFAQLHKGAAALFASVVASINLGVVPAPSVAPLQSPVVTDSFNLTENVVSENSEIFNDLNSFIEEDDLSLKMVMKDLEASEIVTVEQPPVVYTVVEPTPKPSPSVEPKPQTENTESKGDKKELDAKAPSPSPSATPSPVPSFTPVSQGNSNSEAVFQMVNDYRSQLGLKAFEKDERLCKIAEQRAPQVNSELQNGTLHKGFKDLNLPYWASENIAAYSTIQQDFNFWISDYIHKKAIESDNKYSCVACSGASCSQIFTSFVSK
jgi:uncharacterized protein YkwD